MELIGRFFCFFGFLKLQALITILFFFWGRGGWGRGARKREKRSCMSEPSGQSARDPKKDGVNFFFDWADAVGTIGRPNGSSFHTHTGVAPCRVTCFSCPLNFFREDLKCTSPVACSSIRELPTGIPQGSVQLLFYMAFISACHTHHSISSDARQAYMTSVKITESGQEGKPSSWTSRSLL